MPSARKAYKLEKLGFVGRGKSKHRPRNDPALYGGKYPFIQTGDVKNAELYLSNYEQTYNEAGLAQSKIWEPGTLCITIAANIAETCILKIRGCFPDSIVGFTPDPNKADVRFIKYYIDTIKLNMQSVSRGTTQDNLSLEKLRIFDFMIPAVDKQHRIAFVLSAYDDLIENNTRRIDVLEEMAQRIYTEWFVHFRFHGHEKVKMVDSELGRIPSGWEAGQLQDALILQRGFDLPKKKRIHGGFPIYAATGVNGTHNEAKVSAPGVVTGRSGSLGTVMYVEEDFWPLNTTLWIKEFKKATPLYAFYLLDSMDLKRYNSGAAVPTLNRNDVHGLPVILPSSQTLGAFNRLLSPIFGQIRVLHLKNNNLRQTRDLLLPKLISGEVDVSEMEIVA